MSTTYKPPENLPIGNAKFPSEVIKAAIACQKKYPAVPASVTLAQWALESAYGKKDMGVFNFFGIKARDNEPFVRKITWEVIKEKNLKVYAKFRKFSSMQEAFEAHAQLFFRTRNGVPIYAKALASKSSSSFAENLVGVYATDPKYGEKLRRIMWSNNLYKYDKK